MTIAFEAIEIGIVLAIRDAHTVSFQKKQIHVDDDTFPLLERAFHFVL